MRRTVSHYRRSEAVEEENVTATAIDSLEPWIDTRQVGDATITIVSEGGLLWEPRFAVPEAEWRAVLPDADERGRLWIGLNVVFVRLGAALVLSGTTLVRLLPIGFSMEAPGPAPESATGKSDGSIAVVQARAGR